jgi:hypothetical protein
MQTQPKIRDMMPDRYGPLLRERTGKSLVHIYTVVNQEDTNAGIWPEVLRLAEETAQVKQQNRKRLIKLKSNAA